MIDGENRVCTILIGGIEFRVHYREIRSRATSRTLSADLELLIRRFVIIVARSFVLELRRRKEKQNWKFAKSRSRSFLGFQSRGKDPYLHAGCTLRIRIGSFVELSEEGRILTAESWKLGSNRRKIFAIGEEQFYEESYCSSVFQAWNILRTVLTNKRGSSLRYPRIDARSKQRKEGSTVCVYTDKIQEV